MTSVLLLLIVAAALAWVLMPVFEPKKKTVMKSQTTAVKGDVVATEDAPKAGKKRKKQPAFAFTFSLPKKNVARTVVGLLQVLLGVATLVCTGIFYEYSATLAAQEGYDVSVAKFVIVWLGVMLAGALAAFVTGYYTYRGRPRMVRIYGTLEILLSFVFLLTGTWLWPVAASLFVLALCSIIGVGKVTPAYKPVFKSHRFVTPSPEVPKVEEDSPVKDVAR